MSQPITIDLPEETRAALDKAVREEGISQSELIEKALKDYLFIRRFRSLRERLMAEGSGSYTDQDIFDQVS
ncbi:MAG: ribbon-helix-helix protein, CopG family [Pyrinomonadaceae bacterium]|nr:ribbon-helix-helix protein, CopG family [Pyrinomonadaceae bacterium]